MIGPLQNPKRPACHLGGGDDETPAENVLRKLACWLGAGGYNAPTVDAEVFHDKIIWGVEYAVETAVALQTAALTTENARLRGIVPEVLERLNDELCDENALLRSRVVVLEKLNSALAMSAATAPRVAASEQSELP